ncbi:MAG: contact-dependent growth inhibition system immunity protein [Saprospiraceae bacterium]
MIKKQSSAILYNGVIFIVAKQGTESVPAPTDKISTSLLTDDICDIGGKLSESLNSFIPSRQRFTREDWKKVNLPLLELSGVKTEKLLFGNAKLVQVGQLNEIITIYPTTNNGWKNIENKTLADKAISLNVNEINNCDLGLALVNAFEISTLKV